MPRSYLNQHRYTNSLKRAQIYFVRPDVGSTRIQENKGAVDVRLRAAIEKAYKAFVREYRKGYDAS